MMKFRQCNNFGLRSVSDKRSLRISMDFFQTKLFINIFLIPSRFLGGVVGNLAP